MVSSLCFWGCVLIFGASNVAATGDHRGLKHHRRLLGLDDHSRNSSTATMTTSSHSFLSSLNMSSSTTSSYSIHVSPTTTSQYLTVTVPSSSSITTSTDVYLSTLTGLPPNTLNASVMSVTCQGSIIYTDSVPPTVYLTITEGYQVTLTAANASQTAPPILITPASACYQTVVSQSFKLAPTVTCQGNCPNQHSANGPNLSTLTQAPYTSTVYITKKTPVPVIQQSSTQPPLFQSTSTTPKPYTAPSTSRATTPKSMAALSTAQPQTQKATSSPPQSVVAELRGSTAPANFHTTAPTNTTPARMTPASIGDVLSSKIGSTSDVPANTRPETTQHAGDGSQTTKAVNELPVASSKLGSHSSVIIGGQLVAVPTSPAGTTIKINGEVYTVKPSEIIGPHTTIPIEATVKDQLVTTPPPTFVPKTVGGVVFSVDATQAVIAGHTYTIGPGAKPTTVVVGGKTISIGSGGVAFGTTTVAPVEAGSTSIPGPFSVVTVGGMTFALDHSEAVIGGTTYMLTAAETTVIAGHTISLGPGGVAVGSTTVTLPPAETTGLTSSTSTGFGAQVTGSASPIGLGKSVRLLFVLAASVALFSCI